MEARYVGERKGFLGDLGPLLSFSEFPKPGNSVLVSDRKTTNTEEEVRQENVFWETLIKKDVAMLEILKEAIDAVDELNDDVEYVEGLSEIFTYSVQTDGTCAIIKFLGCTLWSSEDDEREFYEDRNEYESLVGFCRRERDKMIGNLNRYFSVASQKSA